MRRKYTYLEILEKERLIKLADEILKKHPEPLESRQERKKRLREERERNKLKKPLPYKQRRTGFKP